MMKCNNSSTTWSHDACNDNSKQALGISIEEHSQQFQVQKSVFVPPIMCMICMDDKLPEDIFRNKACSCGNSFCAECIGKHITVKLQENRTRVINCPGLSCQGLLEPKFCHEIIPKALLDKWEDALLGKQTFYCPYEDCSGLVPLVDETVTCFKCPNCRRQLYVESEYEIAWHAWIKCNKFQKLGKMMNKVKQSDAMVKALARKNKWRRCPRCKFYVEKLDGCEHISCRCGFHFCYRCGSEWKSRHCLMRRLTARLLSFLFDRS